MDQHQVHSDDEDYNPELDEQHQQHLAEQHQRNLQNQQAQQQSQQPQQQRSDGIAEMLESYEELSGIAQLEQRLLDRFTVDAAAQGLYKLF